MPGGSRATWGSVLAGLGSVAALPLAVYVTRFSERYDLLHAGFLIPVAVVLGVTAIALARRSRRELAMTLTEPRRGGGFAAAGHALGALGLCLAASAVVALGVYGLLEYVGSRE